jgi:hypothetical protein
MGYFLKDRDHFLAYMSIRKGKVSIHNILLYFLHLFPCTDGVGVFRQPLIQNYLKFFVVKQSFFTTLVDLMDLSLIQN